jgi:hypothetical protein
MQMRKDSSSLYFDFIEYFVSSVVGRNHYKYHRCDKLLSEFTSVSDEALAILIFENNLDTWKDMAEKNITKNSDVIRKYTNGGSSQGEVASSHRYQGWSSSGLQHFNELYNLVEADRLAIHAKSFEKSFQEFCINGGVNGKKKKVIRPLHAAINIRHSLWSVPNEACSNVAAENTDDKPEPNKCKSDTTHKNDKGEACDINKESRHKPIECSDDDVNCKENKNSNVDTEDSEEDEDPFGKNSNRCTNKRKRMALV